MVEADKVMLRDNQYPVPKEMWQWIAEF